MSQEADASGSREAQARPAEAHEEATCPLCLGPPQAPTRVFPCGHTLCASCAEHWPADGVDCPLCRQLVGAPVSIPPPPPPPPPPPAAPAAAIARRPRRRLRRSRRLRERSPHRSRSRSRSRSVSPARRRSPSGRPLRLVRGLSWRPEPNGRRRDAEEAEDWLREVQERQWGSGDHERRRDEPRGHDGPCC